MYKQIVIVPLNSSVTIELPVAWPWEATYYIDLIITNSRSSVLKFYWRVILSLLFKELT